MRDRWLRPRAITRGCMALALLVLALPLPGIAWCQTTVASPAVGASDYTIGIEDVLQISVWAHPELERTVTVDARGNISIPPVGELKAVGMTPGKLADRISDRLSTYLRQGATTVTVVVRDYISQSVYVSGAVARPGRYGAATAPALFDALNLAGGALPSGDLSRVTIIRRGGAGPHQLTVDVASAMRDGTEAQLPSLRAGTWSWCPPR